MQSEKSFEYWFVPINPATIRAKQLLRKFSLSRFKKINNEEFQGTGKYQCCICSHHGNKKKYPVETMMHIKVNTKREDTPYTYWRHYCKEHTKKYKPHSKRVGGRNY